MNIWSCELCIHPGNTSLLYRALDEMMEDDHITLKNERGTPPARLVSNMI